MITKLMIFAAFTLAGAATNYFLRHRWVEVGGELGLGVELGAPVVGVNRLSGRLRDFDVAIFPYDQAIAIDVTPVDPGFTLGRDSAMARMIKPDIETGSPSFDDKVRIEGDESLVLALLGTEARRATLAVVEEGGTVANGRIRRIVPKIKDAPAALEPMLDLAEALRRPSPEEIPALLARNALEASITGVRLQAFRRLASSYYRSEELLETAKALVDTWEASLKLEACRVMLRQRVSLRGGDEWRAEGERAAEELMQLAVTSHADTSVRRSALELVAGSAFRDAHVPTMAKLLRGPDAEPPEVRRAAIAGLAQARALDELLAVEPGEGAGEAESLARSLGLFREVSAQPRLLDLLDHADDRVRVAAAESLGAVGDVHAVEPLRHAASPGVLSGRALARTVESAIAKIQSRLGSSQAGEISLVGVSTLEGAISPADSELDDARERKGGEEPGGEVSLV